MATNYSENDFQAKAYYTARAKLLDLFGADLRLWERSSSSPCIPVDDCDTPFAVAAASTAVYDALACFTHQQVRVDPDRALLSQRANRYFEIDGVKASTWDTFSGVYECRDGSLVQLHCNFPHHRAAALQALGNPETLDEAKVRAMKIDGDALEQAVLSLGGAAAKVRPLVHRERQFTPLVEIIEVPSASSAKVVDTQATVKVIDLTRVLAGPVATKTIREILGQRADVLTVTSPHLPQIEAERLMTSLGKRSGFCDFNNKEELDQFKSLLSDCDVFVQAFRHGSLQKYGLSDEAFFKLGGKVKVNIRAFETDIERRGYDTLVQCHSGMFDTHSAFVGRREHLPVQTLDYLTGMLAALGALVCLRRRQTTNSHYVVNVSLERTARFYIDDLPMRMVRPSNNNGLGRIELRCLNRILGRKQVGSSHVVTYLKSVLTEDDENDSFVERPGLHPLEWIS